MGGIMTINEELNYLQELRCQDLEFRAQGICLLSCNSENISPPRPMDYMFCILCFDFIANLLLYYE